MRLLQIFLLLAAISVPASYATATDSGSAFDGESLATVPSLNVNPGDTTTFMELKLGVSFCQRERLTIRPIDNTQDQVKEETRIVQLQLCCCRVRGGGRCCGYVVRCGGPIPGCWCD
jgi:hypothetical protein